MTYVRFCWCCCEGWGPRLCLWLFCIVVLSQRRWRMNFGMLNFAEWICIVEDVAIYISSAWNFLRHRWERDIHTMGVASIIPRVRDGGVCDGGVGGVIHHLHHRRQMRPKDTHLTVNARRKHSWNISIVKLRFRKMVQKNLELLLQQRRRCWRQLRGLCAYPG
jgi:hypothetical protein